MVTASAEYHLARACGFGVYVAGAVPAALDIYALRALRAGRDMAAVVVSMAAVNALSHLVSAGVLPVSWPLIVVVSCIAPLVMWRVHVLRKGVHGVESSAAEGANGVRTPTDEGERNSGPVVVERAEPAAELPEPAPVPLPVDVPPAPVIDEGEPPAPPVFFPLPELVASFAGTRADQREPVPDDEPEPEDAVPEPEAELPEPEAEPGQGSGDVLELPPGVSAEHVVTVKTWLAVEPELTGTEIGTRLGTSDSYGRRVRRAATSVPAA
ncbi:hypothetical protein ACFYVL_39980 [Streptomyces sp. NPDC004111]|uniref:hypothetical protein n=1 Tax=Streptomyces sp. NPDC004111 TaxID=3364690 RepID=UPI0036951C1F